MNALALVRRGLRFHWRAHLGVVLGAMCATAVLTGALVIGDSVRQSLREQALARIGDIDLVLAPRERFFREDLAARLASGLPGARTAPALQLTGTATTASGTARAGLVDVLGVDERFLALGPGEATPPAPAAGHAFVSRSLAAQLQVGPGDPIVLRVEKPSLLPREGTLATIDDVAFALRVEVDDVLGDDRFGRFGLRASQIPPQNVFVSLPWLQQQLELELRANLLAVASGGEGGAPFVAQAEAVLREAWTLADVGLRVEQVEVPDAGPMFELTSDRVFLDDAVASAARRVEPGLLGILTGFISELRADDRATPYSTVTGLGLLDPDAEPASPFVANVMRPLTAALTDDGILLNDWIVQDLAVEAGDPIRLTYFTLDHALRLGTAARTLTMRGVTRMRGLAADPGLMPAFPGLEDSERCSEWDTGVPIDLERIRDVDEQYWDLHRGTPKAFVTLRTGQELFGSRFGSLTAVRGPQAMATTFAERLRSELEPAELGLFCQDVRGPALRGGVPASDFGGLFLGLSFFLIGAALLLTALLFAFGVQQRASEIGMLLAVGLRPRVVRRLFLGEASVLLLIGAIPGAALGLGYTRAVLHGLATVWRDTVGATTFAMHVQPATIALGIAIAALTGLLAIAWALRGMFRLPPRELLASRAGIRPGAVGIPARARLSAAAAVGAVALALLLAGIARTNADQAAGMFFGAGALLLLGGLCASHWLLVRLARVERRCEVPPSILALALRSAGRRPGRSLATIALLASGVFLVVSIQAHRLSPPEDVTTRASGTGGFSLFGRSTLPVLRDLDTPAGRAAYGLDDLVGLSIVPMRVRDGDDASCLNLNVPPNPRLLGVRPEQFAERGAFRFVDALPAEGHASANPWLLLTADEFTADDVVPAIADHGSVLWVLHKALGDALEYRDEEGRPFRVRIVATLAGSILQGDLIVAADHFEERFPSATGYRRFLVDAPPATAKAVAARLTRALGDLGFEVSSTADRLRAFQAVQNGYLAIFGALGALALLLGSVGLGVVVLRNVLERRGELALLGAVGLGRRAIHRIVATEHAALLGLGLLVGAGAALLALQAGSGEGLSVATATLPVLAVLASGLLWILLATTFALRGTMTCALRGE